MQHSSGLRLFISKICIAPFPGHFYKIAPDPGTPEKDSFEVSRINELEWTLGLGTSEAPKEPFVKRGAVLLKVLGKST